MLCLGRHEESPEDDRQKMIVAATAATAAGYRPPRQSHWGYAVYSERHHDL